MDIINKGWQEGENCPFCEGLLHYPEVENCSCHLNPPCSACVNNDLVCSKCGEDPYDFEPKKTVILKLTGVCHLEIEGKSPAEAIKMIGPSYQGWHITEKEAKEK